MPCYTYVCETCGEVVDAIRTMDARYNSPTCPKCGNKTKKIVSRINFIGPKNKGNH